MRVFSRLTKEFRVLVNRYSNNSDVQHIKDVLRRYSHMLDYRLDIQSSQDLNIPDLVSRLPERPGSWTGVVGSRSKPLVADLSDFCPKNI